MNKFACGRIHWIAHHFSIYEYYRKESRYAVSLAVMLLPQVNVVMKGLLSNAAPWFTKSVGGSLAIGYQFLSRDGLYLCRLYFHVPRVCGASMCVIMDSRAPSRKSSTVTILETYSYIFQPSQATVLRGSKARYFLKLFDDVTTP